MCTDMNRFLLSLTSWTVAAAALFCVAAPAAAQYKPRAVDDPATGEKYHIEGGADLWFPSADIAISSEQLGIVGDQIDLKKDLGLIDTRFSALQLQLRPARSHKFFLNYTPIDYSQSTILNRDVVFNGIRYKLGLPVNSDLNWKTYEIGYEYDFVVKNWGFVGFDLEAKYTDVQVSLASPIATEFARARPDPGARRHRPLLRGAERRDHRPADRVQDPGQHRQPLQRALHRSRHLRDAELHEQHRRQRRLPLARRRLSDQVRHRPAHTEGNLLRGGG
jgi:hypothetical protein